MGAKKRGRKTRRFNKVRFEELAKLVSKYTDNFEGHTYSMMPRDVKIAIKLISDGDKYLEFGRHTKARMMLLPYRRMLW